METDAMDAFKEEIYPGGPYSYTDLNGEWISLQRQKAFILGLRAGLALLAFGVVLVVGYWVLEYGNCWWGAGAILSGYGVVRMVDHGVIRLRAIEDWEQLILRREQQLNVMRVVQNTARANARN